jgi:hypothetical protein
MAVIRASRLALRDESSETKTRAISGRTLLALLTKSDRHFVSSKMLADIYDWGSNKSMMTFDVWVTALRQACLQRKKSVLHTNARGCSFWPTATATDSRVTHARPPEKMIRKDGRNVLRTPSLAETVMQPKDFPTRNRIWIWHNAISITGRRRSIGRHHAHANRAAQVRITASA